VVGRALERFPVPQVESHGVHEPQSPTTQSIGQGIDWHVFTSVNSGQEDPPNAG